MPTLKFVVPEPWQRLNLLLLLLLPDYSLLPTLREFYSLRRWAIEGSFLKYYMLRTIHDDILWGSNVNNVNNCNAMN